MDLMRHHRQIIERKEPVEIGPRVIAWGVGIALVTILMVSTFVREYRRSIIVGRGIRSNLVIANQSGEVAIVSFDPSEKRITEFTLSDVAIQSRSVGEYKLSQLYKLGSYEGKAGEFVRRKVQGFLRLPLTDYLLVSRMGLTGTRGALLAQIFQGGRSNMSRLDAASLYLATWRMSYRGVPFDTLIKEGAFVKTEKGYEVNNNRLQQFVGSKLFDWAVGAEGVTVAVINNTQVEGLGNDVAKFLTNVGMDVVSVRSGSGDPATVTTILLSKKENEVTATDQVLHLIFGSKAEYRYSQNLEEYRSDVVVNVGKDVGEMF